MISLYKYFTGDLICDVIVCCVLSCNTGKVNSSIKIMFESQKNMEIIEFFLHKFFI